MKEKLEQIRREALAALSETKTAQDLDALRVKYLGKKGALTAVLKQMGGLSAEERPIIGQLANEVREALTTALEQEQKRIEKAALDARLELEQVDVTIPGKPVELGHRHPMYIALDEIKDIFVGMGFQVLDGPEVELAEYNFDKLNAPEGHPSRDWSDTFYFDQDSRVMLRSQTSPMQVRAMETMPLPIRIIAPGRVYRKDEVDATHSPMFHQVEGMVIDKGVALPHLLAPELPGPCMSVITLDKPVKFNHAENDPVKLIVMLLSNHNTAHIKVLEELVDVLGDARKREAIEAAASAYELLSIIS